MTTTGSTKRGTTTITPYLWFNNQAEEAVDFYRSIFKDTKILGTMRDEEGAAGPKGQVLTINFVLNGQEFIALNGGPQFTFNESVSFFISCDTQDEVDYYWNRLISGGGEESRCGWLKDKYGLSWQVVPRVLMQMLQDSDREKAGRAMQAMLQMRKIDIPTLERAYDREEAGSRR